MEVPRNNTLDAKALAVGQLYGARMTEITRDLQRAPADVRFCKTCILVNRWPIQVSGMSAQVNDTSRPYREIWQAHRMEGISNTCEGRFGRSARAFGA